MVLLMNIIISGLLITCVVSENVITSSEQEMDTVMEMLMNNELHEYTDSVEKSIEDKVKEPIFENGVWKCGNCEKVDESKLIYMESYNVEANYDEDYMDLQFGLSVPKMSCVTVMSKVGHVESVSRVAGDCAGEGVTLRVFGTAQYDVKVYE